MKGFAVSYAPGWPVVLRDGPITLRPHRWRDAAAWSEVRLANEAWLTPWEPTRTRPWSALNSVGEYSVVLRSLRKAARAGSMLPFAITYHQHFVGQLTISSVTYGALCSAYAGYWIDSRLAGRGLIPQALAMVVDHAFGTMGLHRIEVTIRPENTASKRVVEKLGFRQESFYARYLHIDGQWRDHLGYALTIEDLQGETLLARWRRSHGQTRIN